MIWKCQIGTNLKTEKQQTAKSLGLKKKKKGHQLNLEGREKLIDRSVFEGTYKSRHKNLCNRFCFGKKNRTEYGKNDGSG